MMAKRLPASQTAAGDALDINTQLSSESLSQSSQTHASQASPEPKRIRTEKGSETPPFLKSKVATSGIHKEHKVADVDLKESMPVDANKVAVGLSERNKSTSSNQPISTTTTANNETSVKKDLNKSQITRYHLRQMIAWNKGLDGLGDVFQSLIRVLDGDPSQFTFYCLLCHQEFSATTSRNAIRFVAEHILEQCNKHAIERKNRTEVDENVENLTTKMQELAQKYQKNKKSKPASKSGSRKKEGDLMKGLLNHRNQVLASYIKTFMMETKLDHSKARDVSMVKSYLRDVLEQGDAFEVADLDDLVTKLQRRYRCA